MREYYEDVCDLCLRNTDLSDKDIAVLQDVAKRLPEICDSKNRDVFINVKTKKKNETVTVALAFCDDSLYDMSTIGYTAYDEDEPAVLRSFTYGIPSKNMLASSYTISEGRHIVQDVTPIFSDGRIIAALIEERGADKNVFRELSFEECWDRSDYGKYPYLKYLDWLGDCLDDAVIVTDSKGIVVYRNFRACQLYYEYGYIYDIFGENYDSVSMHGPLTVSSGIDNSVSSCEVLRGGRYYYVKQCRMKDVEWFNVVIIRDITTEKAKDEDIRLKTEAVREAHHRIKNNLQTIYNLLDMQRRRTSSDETSAALGSTMARIMAIASSYERLLLDGTDRVDIKGILENSCSRFMSIVSGDGHDIIVSVNGDNILVGAVMATDISIVVNELLQNAYKHAFERRRSGHIKVTIEAGRLYSVISVSDDGCGLPENFMQSGGMGFKIAESIISAKLHGKLNCETDKNGTDISFSFKNSDRS